MQIFVETPHAANSLDWRRRSSEFPERLGGNDLENGEQCEQYYGALTQNAVEFEKVFSSCNIINICPEACADRSSANASKPFHFICKVSLK